MQKFPRAIVARNARALIIAPTRVGVLVLGPPPPELETTPAKCVDAARAVVVPVGKKREG
jgi:hypothetical protein